MHHVIIGEGAAGMTAAQQIRQRDPHADITIVADDPNPAYFRAALTNYLLGELGEANLFSVTADFYHRSRVRRQYARVTAIDTRARTVTLHDGSAVAFDRLLIATGAGARRLAAPGADTPGVMTLRTLRDARAMLDLLQGNHLRRAVVVGGGTLGMEWAQAMRRYRIDVFHILRTDVVLAELVDRRASDLILARARDAGVQLRLGEEIAAVERGRDGRVAAVTLKRSGERVTCDIVAVAIGTEPGIACVAGSTLATAAGGIRVDDQMRTSVPDVFAAGDVAAVVDPRTGKPLRYGLWEPARRQGFVAGTNMAGGQARFAIGVTYHATRLWDLDLVVAGRATRAEGDTERVAPVSSPGRLEYRKVVFGGGRLVGALLLGERGAHVRQRGRALHRLIDAGVEVSEVAGVLFDEAFPLDAWADGAAARPVGTQGRVGDGAQGRLAASGPGSAAYVPPSVRFGIAPAAAPARAVPSSAVLRRPIDPSDDQAQDRSPGDAASPDPGAAALELQFASPGGGRRPLIEGLTIGRAPDQAVRVDDPTASAHHAVVHRPDGATVIEDLGSTNGTWVNGVRIQAPHRLSVGDVVIIGGARWSIVTAGQGAAPQAASRAAAGAAPPIPRLASVEIAGRRIPLSDPVVIMGRDPSLTVVADNGDVSRKHAQIERLPDGDYVRDLGSLNSTWINDDPKPVTTPYRLRDGDVIRLGTAVRLVYHDGHLPSSGRG